MATLQHFQEMHPLNGPLPPLRELFLEIQVNKLINDYLFSSSTEERFPLLDDSANGSLEFKENNALPVLPAVSYAAHMVTSNACKSTRHLHEHHMQPSHEAHCAQMLVRASNGARILNSHIFQSCETSIKVKGQSMAQCSKVPNVVCDVGSVVPTAIQNQGSRATCLSRVDTFPCSSKGELQVGVPFKAGTEMKVSSKKPPLPPKLLNLQADKLDPGLKRCFSDMGTFSQSSRRAKLEKKRKSTSSSSTSTSRWALLFTLCFAIIMIGQGFWSQSSDGLAALSTNAPSPVEEYMKMSSWGAQLDVSSQDMLLASRKGVLSRIQRVKREVQTEHNSDKKKPPDRGT